MTETLAAPSDAPVETPTSPKKSRGKAKTATKKVAVKKSTVKAKPSEHPPTSEMVNSAIEELNEKGGSSLQAIKKFIAANYKIDMAKSNIFIRKYLVSAVTSGKLMQTKGTGASGSFKMPGPSAPTKGKRTPVRKVRHPAPKTEIAEKKPAPPKKAKASPPKKTVAKKSKPVKATKVPSKPTPKKLKASTTKPKKALAKKPTKAAASKKKSTPKK